MRRKYLQKKLALNTLWKAWRKLVYGKAKHCHKENRQMYPMETGMASMARKAGNIYVPTELKLAFVIRVQNQWHKPKGPQGTAASPSSSDLPQHFR